MTTFSATYCPEDNKLRLYSFGPRFGDDLKARIKAAGFRWAAKQELWVCPSWSPQAEDLLLELCEEIEDEDKSPEERAADRAERFEGYRDKRADEAHGHADTFDAGPAAFGHQNRARAERQAARHDRHRGRAVTQWGKAEYWQRRTEGVIRHALHKTSASVRRGRILTLEAEQRRHQSGRDEYAKRYNAWQRVLALEGAGLPVVPAVDSYGIDGEKTSPAARLAYTLANSSGCWGEYEHPRRADRKTSIYSLMTDAADPITAEEAARLWLAGCSDPTDPDTNSARYSAHLEMRLTYERAMLAEEGGSAAAADIEPGGWICTSNRTGSVFTNVSTGWKQVQAVNKSPVTGRVVSVKVWGTTWSRIEERNAKPVLVSVNIERLPEGAYRAPTDEERQQFAADKKAAKKAAQEAKAGQPAAPKLLNPTDEDAERLQAVWNAKGAASYADMVKRNGGYDYGGGYKPTEVKRLTQAQYSQLSGGSYSHYETVNVCENGHKPRGRWDTAAEASPVAFKIRKRYGGGTFTGQADAVIVLTDKPQQALPLDWEKVLSGAEAEAVPA